MEKMTYAEALTLAIELIDQCEDSIFDAETECPKYDTVKEKLTALRAQVDKRNSAERKPTKKQTEGEGLKIQILDFLKGVGKARCGDIADAIGTTGQRCSALLSQLVKTQDVVKTTEKRTTFFSLPSDEDAVQALPSELSV